MNSLTKNLGTRKSPRLNNPNINSLFTILAIIMKITIIFGLEITSDFNFCDNSEKIIVDIENSCKIKTSIINEIDVFNLKNFNTPSELIHVFAPTKHLISTIAYECKMTKTSPSTYQNFIGQNRIENFEFNFD
jgi:alkyl sulfatase BDS1-like metallo-beta-lactamase superfamily hydrolase